MKSSMESMFLLTDCGLHLEDDWVVFAIYVLVTMQRIFRLQMNGFYLIFI